VKASATNSRRPLDDLELDALAAVSSNIHETGEPTHLRRDVMDDIIQSAVAAAYETTIGVRFGTCLVVARVIRLIW